MDHVRTLTLNHEILAEFAKAHGLLFLGALPLAEEERYASFQDWLAEGRQASMHYMENYEDVRRDPSRVMTGARSALLFAFSYGNQESLKSKDSRIAQYARLKDYHKFLKQKISAVEQDYVAAEKINWNSKTCVDTAPVLERALAEKMQDSFIGKNTCLIHRKHGSFLLLGELFVDALVEQPEVNPIRHESRGESGGCGTCKRCQTHCPTGALDKDYTIDARKCLSYWTIEHRGMIPEEYWKWLGEYWYGCDICQNVCPFNRNVEEADVSSVKHQPLENLDLLTVATMNQKTYESVFGGSPMTRAKISGLRRNALIAMYVNQHEKLTEAVQHAQDTDDEIVRDTAKRIEELRDSYE